MSLRKIIFFIAIGILLILVMFGVWKLSQNNKNKQIVPKKLSIWVVSDSTEGFTTIIDGFKAANPIYKNTTIEFTKFGSYEDYTKTLLSVLADGKGPDIFVVDAGKDKGIESKIEPIPEKNINLDDFFKRFDTVFFHDIIKEETDKKTKIVTSYLKGVPLGYETLGVFYSKSAFPNFPKTWSDLDLYYTNNQGNNIPAGLGLSPRYIQNGVDIISLFFTFDAISSYTELEKGGIPLSSYLNYGSNLNPDTVSTIETSPSGETDNLEATPEESSTIKARVVKLKENMDQENSTVTDAFIRGEVGLILGYPSLIRELEYAKKRAGDSVKKDIILTAPLPKQSLDSPRKSLARFTYFAISQSSQYKIDAFHFLEYLLTEEAQAKYLKAFPYYISAQTAFQGTQGDTSLSPEFTRTKIGSFIDPEGQKIIFDYGVWDTFKNGLYKIIDRSNNIDINKSISSLGKQIQCELDQTLFQVGIGKNCSDFSE